jgi:membrane-associated phospholipid phosphatase
MPQPRILKRDLKPLAAVAAVGAAALLARALDFDRPTALDRRVRRVTQTPGMDGARTLLAPLFPIGLPGGYIAIAYATSLWLRRRRRKGGPAIVASAWLGWLAHRAMKVGYRRERPPRAGERRRTDSFPSGHTTGATALALTTARVLHREGLISPQKALAIAIGAPFTMGAYRVIADDHWATDVIGGWLLGAAIALACTHDRRRPRNDDSRITSDRSQETRAPRQELTGRESKSGPTRRHGRPERQSSRA